MDAAGDALDLVLTTRASGSGAVCREILSTLPAWFGDPESNDGYVEHCERTPTLVALLGGQAVGLTNIVRHSHWSAEVHLMAVVPGNHRSAVGRRMLQHAEVELAADGVEFLQVKTLSSRHRNGSKKFFELPLCPLLSRSTLRTYVRSNEEVRGVADRPGAGHVG